MNQQALVERIVAEVLGRLTPTAIVAPTSAATAPQGRFHISDQIITADRLAEDAVGRTAVQVSSQAIVTPSARDWLKQNKVELTRITDAQEGSKPTGARWLVVVQTAGQTAETSLEDAGRTGAIGSVQERVADSGTAAGAAIRALTQGGLNGVVVFSAEPEIVACLANRNDKVRAAVVADAAAVARVKSGLNGNVFVVDPDGRSYFEIRNILRRIAT